MNKSYKIVGVVAIIVVAVILLKKEYRAYFFERPILIILAVLGCVLAVGVWYKSITGSAYLPDSTHCNYCCWKDGFNEWAPTPWECQDLTRLELEPTWGVCQEYASVRLKVGTDGSPGTMECCDNNANKAKGYLPPPEAGCRNREEP